MQAINRISNTASSQPWYKHRWPWMLMFGPFVVVVAGIFTAWIAYKNEDALVVDDYYKQGKAINQDLRRERVAAGMKLDATLRYEPDSGKLVGTIASHGQPLPAKVFISLIHSTQPGKDLKLNAHTDREGRFTVNLPMLDMARWQVVLEGEQRDWRMAAVWAWPQQKSIELKADAG